MKENYSKELAFASKLAKKAGKIMLEYFDGDQKVEVKADKSSVTIADKLINSLVIREIARAFPKDGVVGEEESTANYGMGRKWVCDPIDGTKAFIWGTPTAVFSLALVVDGVPTVGVAYDPFLGRLYHAVKGGGAFCGREKLSVSSLSLDKSIVGLTSSPLRIRTLAYVDKLVGTGAQIAVFSGAVYKALLVARGRFAAFVEAGLNPHDAAAAHVIVEEAGGKVTSPDGKKLDYSRPFRGALFSNSVVHEDMIRIANSDSE